MDYIFNRCLLNETEYKNKLYIKYKIIYNLSQ